MSKKIDLTGQRFGKLTAIKEVEKGKHELSRWLCVCDCGRTKIVFKNSLLSGRSRSCGCTLIKHQETRTRLYRIWTSMKNRCNNPNATRFSLYGGRGITVCEEWQHDFPAFRDWAISHGYADNLSIDRIDNDKGYSPDNCRWSTQREQSANRRDSISVCCVETGEIYATVADACRATGASNIYACLCGKQKTSGGYHWKRTKSE